MATPDNGDQMLQPMSRSQSLKSPFAVLALSIAVMGTSYFTSLHSRSPRLISYEQLPPDTGDCDYDSTDAELANLSDGPSLAAALPPQTSAQSAGISEIASRQPVRMIRDPNSAYSAVAVDTSTMKLC